MAPASRRYPWKTFLFLVAAGTLTGPLVLPYFFGLQAIAPHPEPLSMSLGMLVLGAFVRNLILLVPAAGIGLLVARWIGLELQCRYCAEFSVE